jgi:cysteine-S-conjugate beta-lyase
VRKTHPDCTGADNPIVDCPNDDALRQRSSIKWSRIGPGELPADIAELDFTAAPAIRHALQKTLDLSDFGYPDFTAGAPVALKEVFCRRMNTRFRWTITPDRVELSSQIVQALCCAILTFTQAGDSVLMHAPVYPPFASAVLELKRRLVTMPVLDVASAAELATTFPIPQRPVRLIVLCHPHNPTGHVFSMSTLSALAHYAASEAAIVFSDEIYQDLVFAQNEYSPAAMIPGLGDRMITFTSAAKSFNIGGLRCAVGHFGTESLQRAYTSLPWHLRDGAGHLGIAATIAAWQHGDDWLSAVRRILLNNRQLIAAAVAKLEPVEWIPPSAGFAAWLNFGSWSLPGDPACLLRQRAGVALQSGALFGPSFDRHARLNFGTSPERLSRMLDRITRALTAH